MTFDLLPADDEGTVFLVVGDPPGRRLLGLLGLSRDPGGDVWSAHYPANGGDCVGRFRLAALAVDRLIQVEIAVTTLTMARVEARLGKVLR